MGAVRTRLVTRVHLGLREVRRNRKGKGNRGFSGTLLVQGPSWDARGDSGPICLAAACTVMWHTHLRSGCPHRMNPSWCAWLEVARSGEPQLSRLHSKASFFELLGPGYLGV